MVLAKMVGELGVTKTPALVMPTKFATLQFSYKIHHFKYKFIIFNTKSIKVHHFKYWKSSFSQTTHLNSST